MADNPTTEQKALWADRIEMIAERLWNRTAISYPWSRMSSAVRINFRRDLMEAYHELRQNDPYPYD